MANTGIEIVLTLKEVLPPIPPGTPTGNTKPNVEGDPDYIAPYQNLAKCPITYGDSCPSSIIETPTTSTLQFEFSLDNSVVNNPAIKSIKVSAELSGTEVTSTIFNLPNTPSPNFFINTLSGLASSTTYSLVVRYYSATNAGGSLTKTCPGVSFTTT